MSRKKIEPGAGRRVREALVKIQPQVYQYELAKLTGYSQGYLNRLIKDRQTPSEKAIRKIAVSLGADIDFLLYDKGEPFPGGAPSAKREQVNEGYHIDDVNIIETDSGVYRLTIISHGDPEYAKIASEIDTPVDQQPDLHSSIYRIIRKLSSVPLDIENLDACSAEQLYELYPHIYTVFHQIERIFTQLQQKMNEIESKS